MFKFILIFFLFVMNFVNSQNLQIGNCFLYANGKNINCAFIVNNIEEVEFEKYFQFIVVDLSSSKSVKKINDVISCGEVYVSQVYNVMTKKFDDGIFMFDFSQSQSEILNKLTLVGNVNLDSKKFDLGGGGSPFNEQEINYHLNLLNNGHEGYKKKHLSNYLKK